MHVVITGGNSGLGEYLAYEMARRGHTLGLIARRREELERVAAAIRAQGGKVACATADVTDRDALHAAVAALVGEHGPVDLMVAGAGGGGPTPATKHDGRKVTDQMRLNFDGVVYAFEAVLPSMLERGSGHVAAISSVAAYKGMPPSGAYSASKAAVTTLLEAWSAELRPRGIAVTAIHPGFVRTPLTAKNKFPMPFLMEPDRAARLMADGLERRRRRIDYPLRMVWLMTLVRALPAWLFEAAMARTFTLTRPKE
jgi:short-subunit dehydrogenase